MSKPFPSRSRPFKAPFRGLLGLAHRLLSLSLHAGGGRALAHLLSPLHPGAEQQAAAETLRGPGGQAKELLGFNR